MSNVNNICLLLLLLLLVLLQVGWSFVSDASKLSKDHGFIVRWDLFPNVENTLEQYTTVKENAGHNRR